MTKTKHPNNKFERLAARDKHEKQKAFKKKAGDKRKRILELKEMETTDEVSHIGVHSS